MSDTQPISNPIQEILDVLESANALDNPDIQNLMNGVRHELNTVFKGKNIQAAGDANFHLDTDSHTVIGDVSDNVQGALLYMQSHPESFKDVKEDIERVARDQMAKYKAVLDSKKQSAAPITTQASSSHPAADTHAESTDTTAESEGHPQTSHNKAHPAAHAAHSHDSHGHGDPHGHAPVTGWRSWFSGNAWKHGTIAKSIGVIDSGLGKAGKAGSWLNKIDFFHKDFWLWSLFGSGHGGGHGGGHDDHGHGGGGGHGH